MPHPITSPADERNKLGQFSDLMKAKMKSAQGEKVNACPFGCTIRNLDANGYCRHLIGFTPNTEAECKAGKGRYEPMVRVRGNRVVQVDLQCPECGLVITRKDALANVRRSQDADEEEGDLFEDVLSCTKCGPEFLLESYLMPVKKDDVIVQITCSSRVYRDVAKQIQHQPDKPAPVKKAKRGRKSKAVIIENPEGVESPAMAS